MLLEVILVMIHTRNQWKHHNKHPSVLIVQHDENDQQYKSIMSVLYGHTHSIHLTSPVSPFSYRWMQEDRVVLRNSHLILIDYMPC